MHEEEKTRDLVVTVFVILISGLLLLISCRHAILERAVHAQEKSPRQTRQWLAATIRGDNFIQNDIDVHVIDTEGVCLYIARRSGTKVAIAAVPKTQLPSGTGCQ